MCIFKIVKPLSTYIHKVLYMINYSKQITTLQDTLLAVYVKKKKAEKFSSRLDMELKASEVSFGLQCSSYFSDSQP